MKLLKKIKLINWHYFWNESFNIEPLVFLTGENGSGKTTLIDAFEVVLLGDTTGRSFNKAALDKSTRTLKGYLRGELGDTLDGGFKYLRNGRFTSYIALEFLDNTNDSPFTLGIVFDSFEDGTEEHRFFTLDDKIPENEFIEENIPLSYKDLHKYLKENYEGRFQFFDSNKQYQEYLKKKMGGLKDKYFSLLKKATSFNPITDIKTFITQYVCDPQENLDLSHLQDNIVQYSKLKKESENIEKRILKLEDIKESFDQYKIYEKDFNKSKYLIEKCEIESSKEKLTAFKNEVERCKERIKEIDVELKEHEGSIFELERRKMKLIQDRANNDVLKLTDDLYDEKKEVEKKIRDINDEINSVKVSLTKYLESYEKEAKRINDELGEIDFTFLDSSDEEEISKLLVASSRVINVCSELRVKLSAENIVLTEDTLINFKDTLKEFKENVSRLSISFVKTIRNLEGTIRTLKEEEKEVQKGTKPLDSRLKVIKARLKEELERRFNKVIDVELYCDLIDIKDESWTNAIEGYLSGQKFNIFVPPKYYNDAYKILKRLLEEYNFYQTALVDEEKIVERDYKMEYNSLAEEIETDHEGARCYTNFLIGRLYKAETIEEARESQNGITRDCDLYRAFTLSRINPRLYSQSFIGRGVKTRFLEEKSRELKSSLENLSSYQKLYNLINEANTLEVLTQGEIEHLLKMVSRGSEIKGLEETLSYLENELKEHDTTLLQSLDKRLNDVDEDIKDVNHLKETILIEKGNLEKEIEALEKDKIINETNLIKEKEESLVSQYDENLVKDEIEPYFENEIKEGRTITEILVEAKTNLSRLQYLSANLFSNVCKLRRDYVHEYHLSYDPDIRDNKVFEDELINFKEVKLVEYEQKIHDSYLKATQQFKDDFIFKLRGAIEDVEDQIDNLNSALSKSSFGKDSYKFLVKPSPLFRRYYDMLKDDIILEGGEDESVFLNKYQDVMEDLFKMMIDVNDNDSSKDELYNNIEKFTDYRSYLDFDLVVYNKDTKEEQRLSRMIKKKSGGETQTPFYIAILASFAQLYHVHEEGDYNNTSRIVIFDEAFSKMDKGRIKEAIKLLGKFDLQAIISCPTNKVQDLSTLVDETLVVMHKENSSTVLTFKDISKPIS